MLSLRFSFMSAPTSVFTLCSASFSPTPWPCLLSLSHPSLSLPDSTLFLVHRWDSHRNSELLVTSSAHLTLWVGTLVSGWESGSPFSSRLAVIKVDGRNILTPPNADFPGPCPLLHVCEPLLKTETVILPTTQVNNQDAWGFRVSVCLSLPLHIYCTHAHLHPAFQRRAFLPSPNVPSVAFQVFSSPPVRLTYSAIVGCAHKNPFKIPSLGHKGFNKIPRKGCPEEIRGWGWGGE